MWPIARLFVYSIWSMTLCAQAIAYDKAGHFYSVAMMTRALAPTLSEDDADVIAFCSQLPDESRELDAVETAKNAFLHEPLGFMGFGAPPATTRMLQTQILLHGLTGGPSDALSRAATSLVNELLAEAEMPAFQAKMGVSTPTDPNLLCAIGFAFHLLGDSYAHRRLRNEEWLYGPTLGHAVDQVMPDRPLYIRQPGKGSCVFGFQECRPPSPTVGRLEEWKQYVRTELKGQSSQSAPAQIANLVDKVGALAATANVANSWNESAMRTALFVRRSAKQQAVLSLVKRGAFTALPACSDVIACANEAGAIVSMPVCKDAWTVFASSSSKAVGAATELRRGLTAARELSLQFDDTDLVDDASREFHLSCEQLRRVPNAPERLHLLVANVSPMRIGMHAEPADATGLEPSSTCVSDQWSPNVFGDQSATIYFRTNEARVEKFTASLLARWRLKLRSAANGLRVVGYADTRGADDYNLQLSRQRAATVEQLLTLDRSASGKVQSVARGALDPPCDPRGASRERCWCMSRRVTVELSD
jgi:outer membrane protein OmpA-like peptidoglycan-associated protein